MSTRHFVLLPHFKNIITPNAKKRKEEEKRTPLYEYGLPWNWSTTEIGRGEGGGRASAKGEHAVVRETIRDRVLRKPRKEERWEKKRWRDGIGLEKKKREKRGVIRSLLCAVLSLYQSIYLSSVRPHPQETLASHATRTAAMNKYVNIYVCTWEREDKRQKQERTAILFFLVCTSTYHQWNLTTNAFFLPVTNYSLHSWGSVAHEHVINNSQLKWSSLKTK